MANENGGAKHYYPLTKMNFIVDVMDVAGVAAFTEVTGVDAAVDVIEFRQGNAASLAPVKLQGLVKHSNITLKMGYVSGQAITEWIRDCVSDVRGKVLVRKNVTIELIDIVNEGAPTSIREDSNAGGNTWVLKNAWVAKYSGPDLNASTSEVAIETLELAYEELTMPTNK